MNRQQPTKLVSIYAYKEQVAAKIDSNADPLQYELV